VVTDAGKQLTLKLLVADPADRLTAAEVLEDPWMTADESDLDLPGVLETLRSSMGMLSMSELDQVDDMTLDLELCAPLD
ncbi:hypothetical protein AaE_000972, partial [Aphanomyces astaci]